MTTKPLILSLSLLLAGCITTPPSPDLTPTTVEVTKYVPYECGQPPPVTHVSFLEVDWKLIAIDGEVVWTLSAQEYADLGQNMSDILQATKELEGSRKFWEDCVARSKEAAKNLPDR